MLFITRPETTDGSVDETGSLDDVCVQNEESDSLGNFVFVGEKVSTVLSKLIFYIQKRDLTYFLGIIGS